jgi:hypothetical protein
VMFVPGKDGSVVSKKGLFTFVPEHFQESLWRTLSLFCLPQSYSHTVPQWLVQMQKTRQCWKGREIPQLQLSRSGLSRIESYWEPASCPQLKKKKMDPFQPLSSRTFISGCSD